VGATAASIVKTTYIGSYDKSHDQLFVSVSLVKWSMVEINFSNITSSLPTLQPLLRRILEKAGYSFTNYTHKPPNGPSYALQSLDYGVHKSLFWTMVDTRRHLNSHDSEENMIIASGGIIKTSEINVEVEEGNQRSQLEADPEAYRRNLQTFLTVILHDFEGARIAGMLSIWNGFQDWFPWQY
ncbi:hypothetical protein RUND412_007895, partial [Rhizina undulata]